MHLPNSYIACMNPQKIARPGQLDFDRQAAIQILLVWPYRQFVVISQRLDPFGQTPFRLPEGDGEDGGSD